jgi:hypothetical protein
MNKAASLLTINCPPKPQKYLHIFSPVTAIFSEIYTILIHVSLSRHENAGQNHDIKIAKRCFENVAQFSYLGTTIRNQT